MPITAKLSRKFYERFGDAVVDELVDLLNQVDAAYRSDIRQVVESNVGRFEGRLDRFEGRLERFEGRLVRFEGKLVGFEGKLEGFEAKLVGFEAKLDQRFSQMEALLHRELRGQLRFLVGLMVVLWTSLLIPIIGLWWR